jgi:hypothetical protein
MENRRWKRRGEKIVPKDEMEMEDKIEGDRSGVGKKPT